MIVRLKRGGVDFVLAGGFGAIARGGSMVTRDVDVACRMEPENLLKIFTEFQDLHPVHRMTSGRLPFTREQAEAGGLKNLDLTTTWGQLDCLGEIKGIGDYAACLAASEPLDIDGESIQVLGLDAMILAKRAMNRPRDLHAALELEAIREKLRHQP